MIKTNYADIAARYDENAVRHQIPKDAHLERLLADSARTTPLEALDLACGTGNYLVAQRAFFGDRVRFRGLDASADMLERARQKLPDLELKVGPAEALPYPDACFDYVTSSFAFHHFEDKPRALDELRRVSKPGAGFRYRNVDPSRMPGNWVFTFFPEAALEDLKRYWRPELLRYELERRGYSARVHVDVDLAPVALRTVLEDVERRDVSELRIITEEAYQRGLGRVRDALARTPDGEVDNETAVVTIDAGLGR